MVDFLASEMQVAFELAIKNLGQGDQACLSRELLHGSKHVSCCRDFLSKGE